PFQQCWQVNKYTYVKSHYLYEIKTIQMLMNAGVNIHAGNEHLLEIAATNGAFDIVKYLIELGTNYHTMETEKILLENAIIFKQFDMINFFIDNGINVCTLNSALSVAAAEDNIDI